VRWFAPSYLNTTQGNIVNHPPLRPPTKSLTGVATAIFAACGVISASLAAADPDRDHDRGPVVRPIKHIVVIFQENASFDHYFATYPDAKNTDGIRFVARANTPAINGLTDGNSQFPERVNVALHDFNPNTTVGPPTGLNPNGGASRAPTITTTRGSRSRRTAV
jgi:phospholipase C